MNLELVVDNDEPGLPDQAGEVGVVSEEDRAEDLGGDLGEDGAGDQPGAAGVLPVQGDHGGGAVQRPGRLAKLVTANLAAPGLAQVSLVKRGQSIIKKEST